MGQNYTINSESDLSAIMCKILSHAGSVQRHEDKYNAGIPDLSYALPIANNGWLELKYLDTLPTTGYGGINIPCFTEEQKLWLEHRGSVGSNCFLLLYAGDKFILIPYYKLCEMPTTPWVDIKKLAASAWHNTTPPHEIVNILTVLSGKNPKMSLGSEFWSSKDCNSSKRNR